MMAEDLIRAGKTVDKERVRFLAQNALSTWKWTQEKEVAFLVAEGFLNSDVARKLGVSSKTVRNYKVHIRQKLQLNTPAEISLFMQKIRSILKD